MADAVARAFTSASPLLVQAGTGTGKSLAYLIPALRHAVLADERVVVATATLALQRQILTKDLPIALEAIGESAGRTPTAAVLKGRNNYLCRHKLDGGYPIDEGMTLFDPAILTKASGESAADSAEPSAPTKAASESPAAARDTLTLPSLVDQVRSLHAWAKDTETGDRDEAPEGTSEKAWRQVSVSALECLGQRCPLQADCFADAARHAAVKADLVVTNHALLAIHATTGQGLPDFDALVVDEAHDLENRFTSAMTLDLSEGIVKASARAAGQAGCDTDALEKAAEGLGATLAIVPDQRFRGVTSEGLLGAVDAVRAAARTAFTQAGKGDDAEAAGEKAAGAKAVARAALDALITTADAIAQAGEDSGRVLWCARPARDGVWRAGPPALHAAPLDVSEVIRERVIGERGVVFTSATLAGRGNFAPAGAMLGLPDPPLPAEPEDGDGEARREEDAPEDWDREAPQDRDGETPKDRDGETPKDRDGEAPQYKRKGAPRGWGNPPGELRWTGLDVGSPFDYATQGICYIAADLPAPGRDGVPEAEQHALLAELIEAAGGRMLGLFTSQRAAEAAAKAVRSLVSVPVSCQGEEATSALLERFVAEEERCLFGTLSLWQGVDAPGPTCRVVAIDRLPFPRPDDPVLSARQEAAGPGGFMSVTATHAAIRLAQGTGRLIRGPEDRGVVAILDPRLATARYAHYLRSWIPPYWYTTDRAIALAALTRLNHDPTPS